MEQNTETKKDLTIEMLDDSRRPYENIEFALSFIPEYQQHLRKPCLKSTSPTLEESKKYTEDLKAYVDDKVKVDLLNDSRRKIENKIYSIIIDYIKEESGLNQIPEQYRDKVYRKAYEDGHSSGHYEVYQKLVELVEIFVDNKTGPLNY